MNNERMANAEKIAAGLLALAGRVEAATGPDREMDREIELAIYPDRLNPVPTLELLAYTASIDAAMTLVPEGWDGALYLAADTSKPTVQLETPEMRARFSMDYEGVTGTAGTLALALCAAALRAREILRRQS